MIELYTAPTPYGWKISIALEALGLAYQLHEVDLKLGEQTTPEFLALNPNGRIPVIVDRDNGITIFESGAILIYLAEKTGRLMPHDQQGRYEVLQWLMFQMSGIGPMQGQAVVFERYFPQDVPAAKARYHNETQRLYGVLNQHLADRDYLAHEYSIADIANWAWVRSHRWARISIDELPHLARWIDRLWARPALAKGVEIPPSPGTSEAFKAMGSSITTQ